MTTTSDKQVKYNLREIIQHTFDKYNNEEKSNQKKIQFKFLLNPLTADD